MTRELFTRIRKAGSVAVVGMAKNTGKTVTINYLIHRAGEAGVSVAITSTGRDGETTDSISSLPKPIIELPVGALLATARGSLNKGKARLEILENTGITNPLGEIVIARVKQAGNVEVCGPERNGDLKQVIESLLRRTELVIVDGALDRRAASTPALTKATILATGAVVAPTPELVAIRTVYQVKLLTLPGAEDLTPDMTECVLCGQVAVSADGEVYRIFVPTAIDGPVDVVEQITGPGKTLLLGGALSEQMLEPLIEPARLYGLRIVVRDGSRIFVPQALWQRFVRAGGRVEVVEPINLVAITVNPTDPRGRQFPVGQLESMIAEFLPDTTVLNPLATGR